MLAAYMHISTSCKVLSVSSMAHTCTICELECRDGMQLKNHKRKHTARRWFCNGCSQQFNYPGSPSKHARMVEHQLRHPERYTNIRHIHHEPATFRETIINHDNPQNPHYFIGNFNLYTNSLSVD